MRSEWDISSGQFLGFRLTALSMEPVPVRIGVGIALQTKRFHEQRDGGVFCDDNGDDNQINDGLKSPRCRLTRAGLPVMTMGETTVEGMTNGEQRLETWDLRGSGKCLRLPMGPAIWAALRW